MLHRCMYTCCLIDIVRRMSPLGILRILDVLYFGSFVESKHVRFIYLFIYSFDKKMLIFWQT